MCGIIGIVNGPAKVESDWITQALYADAVRGWDSTGIIAVRGGQTETYKRALPAADFISSRAYKRIIAAPADAFIGHNRAATVGKVVDETAHPFKFDHITGVHNGTLEYGWRDTLKDGTHFDVDSEALIYNIAEVGIEATVKKAHGAFAIVYHDSRNNTLNIIRNKERPMHYGRMNYKENRWVFGSEAGLIEWITERTDSGDRLQDVWELPVGKLLTIDLDTAEMSFTDMPVAGRSAYTHGPFTGKGNGNYQNRNTYTSHTGRVNSHDKSKGPNVTLLPKERAAFDGLGIDHSVETEFWFTDWVPYANNNTTGVAKGCTTTSPYLDVVIYGVFKDDMVTGGVYKSYPVTIRKKAGVSTPLENTPEDKLELVMSATHVTEIVYQPLEDHKSEIIQQDEEPWLLSDRRPIGPSGERLGRVEFDRLTSKGCSCCNANIIYGVDPIDWTVGAEPLCVDCSPLYGSTGVGQMFEDNEAAI